MPRVASEKHYRIRPGRSSILMTRHEVLLQKMLAGEIPQPDLPGILRRLADAEGKDALVKAADDLKGFVQNNPYGLIQLDRSIERELNDIMKPMLEAAKTSLEKRVTLGQDVIAAWSFVGKAGAKLVELNRVQKFGDGKRAFQILFTYVDTAIHHLLTCGDSDWDILSYCHQHTHKQGIWGSIDYEAIKVQLAEEAMKDDFSEEEEDQHDANRDAAMWDVINSMEGPLAGAVKKARKEQKRSKMAHDADELEDDFGRLLCMVAERGCVRKDDMGFDLFEEARSEMREWVDGAGERPAGKRGDSWF